MSLCARPSRIRRRRCVGIEADELEISLLISVQDNIFIDEI